MGAPAAPCLPSRPVTIAVLLARSEAPIGPPPAAVRALAAALEDQAGLAADAGHVDALVVAAGRVLGHLVATMSGRARAELCEALAGYRWPGGTWRPAMPEQPPVDTCASARAESVGHPRVS